MLLSIFLKVVMAAMWLGSNIAQNVTQSQSALLVQEKEAVTLDCTYDTTAKTYSLIWYKQLSSGAIIFLIRHESYSPPNATEGRYSLNFEKEKKSVNLVISASQLEDSALYICALRESTVRHLLEEGASNPQGSA